MKYITHIDRITYIDNLSIQFLKEKDFEEEIVLKTFSFHTHPYIEIFTCNSTPYQVKTVNETITLNKNDVLIIPANTPHFRVQKLSELPDGICFGAIINKFANNSSENLLSTLFSFNEINNIIYKKRVPDFYDTAKSFLDKITETDVYSPKIKLIYKLCEIAESLNNKGENKIRSNSDDKHIATIINLEHILNTKYMKSLSGADIAKMLFISERQLYRIVTTHYNKTLHQLLLEKRLDGAKTLLLSSNISTEDIAYIVGFQNKVSFYREFKKKFGTTPLQFRKLNK